MARSKLKKTGIKNKGARRKTRGRGKVPAWQARALFLARRFGAALGVLVFVLWLGAWIFLSDTPGKLLSWGRAKILEQTAAAGFVVKDILVEGRKNTDSALLLAVLNIAEGDPLFALDPRSARAQIEKIVWVRAARVERRLPGTIYIGLTERRPFALWKNEGKWILLDEEGRAITVEEPGHFVGLITLSGDEAPVHAPDFIALLRAEPVLFDHVHEAARIAGRRWDVTLKNGVQVKLPEEDIGVALRRLVKAQEADGLWDKDIESLDLRNPERIVIRTKPGGLRDYKTEVKASAQ